jgi:hypothetical protein
MSQRERILIRYYRSLQAGRCLIDQSLPGLCRFCEKHQDYLLSQVMHFGDDTDGTLFSEG